MMKALYINTSDIRNHNYPNFLIQFIIDAMKTIKIPGKTPENEICFSFSNDNAPMNIHQNLFLPRIYRILRCKKFCSRKAIALQFIWEKSVFFPLKNINAFKHDIIFDPEFNNYRVYYLSIIESVCKNHLGKE